MIVFVKVCTKLDYFKWQNPKSVIVVSKLLALCLEDLIVAVFMAELNQESQFSSGRQVWK